MKIKTSKSQYPEKTKTGRLNTNNGSEMVICVRDLRPGDWKDKRQWTLGTVRRRTP